QGFDRRIQGTLSLAKRKIQNYIRDTTRSPHRSGVTHRPPQGRLSIVARMSLTESTMVSLGTPAPEFKLPDVVSGRTISLKNFAAQHALLVMFICRHCPYVQHVQNELARLGRDYGARNVGIV